MQPTICCCCCGICEVCGVVVVQAIEADGKYSIAWDNLGCVGGGTVDGKEYTKKECYEKVHADVLYSQPHMAWLSHTLALAGELGGFTISMQCQRQ